MTLGGTALAAFALIAVAPPASARPADPVGAASVHPAFPTLRGYVTDEARLLAPGARDRLTRQLAAFERRTHHQFVVVTVRSLGGADVGDYTRDLGRTWGIGRKGINDGVVVLLAPAERRARIAVGYGLERALPDPLCRTIMKREMVPRFAAGDYAGGLQGGVSALIAAVGS